MEAMVTADMATPVMGIRVMVTLTMDTGTRHIGTATMGVGTTATGTQAKAVGGAATGMPTVLDPVGGSHPLAGFGFAIERAEERPMLSR